MPWLRCFVLMAAFFLTAPAFARTFAQTAPGSAAHGRLVFLECSSCHSISSGSQGLTGPSLQGIYGRHAAALPGYAYSSALKTSGLTWTDANLDAWLTNPTKLVPGTNMAFAGIAAPAQRADLIAYLKTLK